MRIMITTALFVLTACSPATDTRTSESGAQTKVQSGDVALVAIAPDGTKLWAVKPSGGRTVYFASSVAQTRHSESCGKNCIKTVDDVVPTQ